MTKSKANRRTIILTARGRVVDALESVGLTCILVREVATSLYDPSVVPKAIHVAVIAPTSGLLAVGEVWQLLAQRDPTHFCLKNSVLRYSEPSILLPNKNWCKVILVPVPNPPPPQYESTRIKRRSGLPVVSVLPLVFDAISGIQTAPRLDNSKGKKRLRLLQALSKHELTAIDAEFHSTLLAHLVHVASFSPELERVTSNFIRFCRGEPASAAEICRAVDGVPDDGEVDAESGSEDEVNDEDDVQRPSSSDPRPELITVASEMPLMPAVCRSPVPPAVTLSRPYIIKKKQDKQLLIANASRHLALVLQYFGIRCILHKRTAAFEYGTKNAPAEVEIAILKETEQDLFGLDHIIQLLVYHRPDLFHLRNLEGNRGQTLSYFEPSIQPPKKNCCDVRLTLIAMPLPPQYADRCLVRLNGLLTVSLLPVVVDTLREYIETGSRSGTSAQMTFGKGLPVFLERCSMSLAAILPIDQAYHREALSVFNETCGLIPNVIKTSLRPFIDFCQDPRSSIDKPLLTAGGTGAEDQRPQPTRTNIDHQGPRPVVQPASEDHYLEIGPPTPTQNSRPSGSSLGEDFDLSGGLKSTIEHVTSLYDRSHHLELQPLHGMAEVDAAIFFHARQDAVDILESVKITCILVNEAAASFYCAVFDPEIVHIVVIPQKPGLLSISDTSEILIRWDPIRFQFNGSHLQYCEPSIPQSKKTWCQIELIPVPNPPPPQYAPSCVQRLEDLPVASPLLVVFDAIHDLQTAPEKQSTDKLLQLLNAVSKHDLIAIDDEFHRTLLGHLQRVADFSPEFQQATSRFLRFCQGERFEISGTVDDRPLHEGKPEGVEVLKLASSVLDPMTPIKDYNARAELALPVEDLPEPPGPRSDPEGGSGSPEFKDEEVFDDSPITIPENIPTFSREYIGLKVDRQKLACGAVRRILSILHSVGIWCVAINKTAAFEYGLVGPPKDLEFAIIPSRNGVLSPDTATDILINRDPAHFLTETRFYYREPGTRNRCSIAFIPIPNPTPVEYAPERLVLMNDVPSLSLLPIIIYTLCELLLPITPNITLPDDGHVDPAIQPKSKKVQDNIRYFLIGCLKSTKALLPIDEQYHRAALSLFRRIVEQSPGLEKLSRRFVRFCKENLIAGV